MQPARSSRLTTVLFFALASIVASAQAQEEGGPPSDEAAEVQGDDGIEAQAEPYGQEPVGGEEMADDQEERGFAGQGDRAAAESLARVGKSLMELGQYADACPKLEQSVEAAPTGDTNMALAECQERLGKIASAWASYRQAAAMLANDQAAAEVAHQGAVRLEARVPKLTISSGMRLPGMEVWRDDIRFGPGILGVPLAVDPGQVRVEVRAPGHEPWSTTVAVKPSERVAVQVPMLVAQPKAQPTAITTTQVAPSRGGLFLAGVITAGAGVAGMAIGAILGASAARDVSRAESDEALCGADRACSPAGRDVIDGAESKALASTLSLSIGAVALAGGFVMVLVEPAFAGGGGEETGADAVSAVVVPWGGPDGGGLSVEMSF